MRFKLPVIMMGIVFIVKGKIYELRAIMEIGGSYIGLEPFFTMA